MTDDTKNPDASPLIQSTGSLRDRFRMQEVDTHPKNVRPLFDTDRDYIEWLEDRVKFFDRILEDHTENGRYEWNKIWDTSLNVEDALSSSNCEDIHGAKPS